MSSGIALWCKMAAGLTDVHHPKAEMLHGKPFSVSMWDRWLDLLAERKPAFVGEGFAPFGYDAVEHRLGLAFAADDIVVESMLRRLE